MKIRSILFVLTAFLGAALLLAVTVPIRSELQDYRSAQQLVASNAVRAQLLLASEALAEERSRGYVLLMRPVAERAGLSDLGAARVQIDTRLHAAADEVRRWSQYLDQPEQSLLDLEDLVQDLRLERRRVDKLLPDGSGPERLALAPSWFRGISQIINRTNAVRLRLLRQEQPSDPVVQAEGQLRHYASLLADNLAQSQALLAGALNSGGRLEPWAVEESSRTIGRAELSWQLINGQKPAIGDTGLAEALGRAERYFDGMTDPLQQAILESLRLGETAPVSAEHWFNTASEAIRLIGEIQRQALRSSGARLERSLAESRRAVTLWAVLLAGGFAAVLASILVVRGWVVRPLEAVGAAMLRLADNDLSTPLPRLRRADELGQMGDALRVFKANAIRRHRLQQDKQALHERLREAYRQLRRDLEAAAAIQTTLLPEPAVVGGVRHHGLFRPSSVVAGDTYNVLGQDGGRVGFFQIDVAGHGAPAALVSVASHHALSQALLKQDGADGIEGLVSQINADWPEGLPYFTMVLGAIDPNAGRAVIVQAGHPPPLLIHRDGAVEPIGEGGLPVGLVEAATYDRVAFDFAPGDRLMLYSDGLVEAENAAGEPFLDERVAQIAREHAGASTEVLLQALDGALRSWRGSESLDDDVTILVFEHIGEGRGNDAERRAA